MLTVKVNFHGKNCLAPANCLDGFLGKLLKRFANQLSDTSKAFETSLLLDVLQTQLLHMEDAWDLPVQSLALLLQDGQRISCGDVVQATVDGSLLVCKVQWHATTWLHISGYMRKIEEDLTNRSRVASLRVRSRKGRMRLSSRSDLDLCPPCGGRREDLNDILNVPSLRDLERAVLNDLEYAAHMSETSLRPSPTSKRPSKAHPSAPSPAGPALRAHDIKWFNDARTCPCLNRHLTSSAACSRNTGAARSAGPRRATRSVYNSDCPENKHLITVLTCERNYSEHKKIGIPRAMFLNCPFPHSHQHLKQNPKQHPKTAPALAPQTACPLAPSRQYRKSLSPLYSKLEPHHSFQL